MKITKIIIERFKSIERLEFDIQKYGSSYTTMLLGKNESGKSNILEAMSFFKCPDIEFDYNTIHNQKDESRWYIDLWFYLEFWMKKTYLDAINKLLRDWDKINFRIIDLVKNVYLAKDKKNFTETVNFDIELLTLKKFINKVVTNSTVEGKTEQSIHFEIHDKNNEEWTLTELTKDIFLEYFSADITALVKRIEPPMSFWKPSDRYLISEVDLVKFKDNIYTNIPLRNIFALSWYKTSDSVKQQIDQISNSHLRRKLMLKLSKSTTKYVKKIWKHNIEIDIEITDSERCIVSIKDWWKENEDNFHPMTSRSEGFKQFMSLILSLSIETKELWRKDRLILIDEPESHLHPGWIRDLREELLEIGKNNYLFVSTHSPFLVDKKNKERNIIVKKNTSAITEIKKIREEQDIRDDEVLDLAFGINVYKDLLNPNRILVEWECDKNILEKIFKLKKCDFGITNGTGSNIVTVASRLNHDDIKTLVLVDDDKEWQWYKDKILKIGWVYWPDNVFTIRDLVWRMKNEWTIEDMLGKDFVQTQFNKFYKLRFDIESTLILDDSAFINQIKVYLHKQSQDTEEFIFDFKKHISNTFKPSKTTIDWKFPYLKDLFDQIQQHLR